MSTRRLMTNSLPPPLLKKAEAVAHEENRTKSDLLREALRFYVGNYVFDCRRQSA